MASGEAIYEHAINAFFNERRPSLRRFGVAQLFRGRAILMVLPVVANTGLNQWTSNGPASSGSILSLVVDPSAPETVYASSGITGVLAGTGEPEC